MVRSGKICALCMFYNLIAVLMLTICSSHWQILKNVLKPIKLLNLIIIHTQLACQKCHVFWPMGTVETKRPWHFHILDIIYISWGQCSYRLLSYLQTNLSEKEHKKDIFSVWFSHRFVSKRRNAESEEWRNIKRWWDIETMWGMPT